MKAAKQRTQIALLQQTMLIKVVLERKRLQADADKLANELDEEAERLREWEEAQDWQHQEHQQEHDAGEQHAEVRDNTDVRLKVPGYTWDQISDATHRMPLLPDPLEGKAFLGKTIRVPRRGARSSKSTIRIGGYGGSAATFPLRLWEPAGQWWGALTWSSRTENRTGSRSENEVSWLELVVDFELATGHRCTTDVGQEATWGERAKILKSVITKLVEVRGINANALKTWYGKKVKV